MVSEKSLQTKTPTSSSSMSSTREKYAIGIDLGTTNSCVSVLRRGRIKIIPNEQGEKTTPSYVLFTELEQLIGYAAKNSTDLQPENTIFDAKRLIGRDWDDESVQHNIKHWPFKVRDIDNTPHIEITFKVEKKLFLPEQISAMVLGKLRETAETYLKKNVNDAVITVPAYFNDAQRQATVDAGRIAGLNVLKIINEPTAAAIAYAHENNEYLKEGTNILVFDLGGGTLDVAILRMEKDCITVKATNGNTHLGGEDIDCLLVDYCVEKFKRIHKFDLSSNATAMRRLRSACERSKRDLSHSFTTTVAVYHIHKEIDFSIEISRSRFEEIIGALLKETLKPVEKALSDANYSKSEIHKTILVGGSSRIPMLKALLTDFFGSKIMDPTINVDTAVAHGAAVQAAALIGETPQTIGGRLLRDVTPLSLGTDSELYPSMSVIIPRNTVIPVKKTVTYSTTTDFQNFISIEIRQGENKNINENCLLGKFYLREFAEAPKGVPWIDVTFEIDSNGIITVTARDKTTGSEESVKIDKVSGRMRKDEIDKIIEENKNLRKEMDKLKKAKRASVSLENECFEIKRKCERHLSEAPLKEKEILLKMTEDILVWVEDHKCEKEEAYHKRKKDIRSYAQKLIDKYKRKRYLQE